MALGSGIRIAGRPAAVSSAIVDAPARAMMRCASASFAGKGMFLQAHGYDEVLGREDWLAVNPDVALNQWGLNDDDLFKIAWQRKGVADELVKVVDRTK